MNKVHPPPQYLLGSSLIFWGVMSGRPLVGFLAALIVEGRYWVRLRWDFDDNGYARAWQLTTLVTAATAVLLVIEGSRYTALPDILSWVPVLIIPVQFVQSYGLRDSIPLSTISYFARRNRLRAERLGLPMETRSFHFGNVMFFLCLLSASVELNVDVRFFLPGLLVLCAWRIIAMHRCRARVLLPILMLAGMGGFTGEYAIRRLEDILVSAGSEGDGKFDPTFTGTMIGTTGDVNLSSKIQWRLRLVRGTAPQLLRTATFSTYLGTSWQARRAQETDFQNLENRLVGEDLFYQTTRANAQTKPTSTLELVSLAPTLPAFTLRGSAFAGDPLPLPGDVAGVSGLQADRIEGNTFGTIRIFPKDPVLNGTVFWRSDTQPDLPPVQREDLRVPMGDSEALRILVAEIGLSAEDEMPVTLAKLRTWFQRNFQYSKHLTIRHREGGDDKSSPIARFLMKVRSGHCEYFATGAALLLRQCGIPTRYSTGFAVAEYESNRKEFIIRGTHGHAWCRVWNGMKWIDFDPTPPNWLTDGFPQPTVWQRMDDALTRLREDFFLWRTQPENQLVINVMIATIGIGLAGFVIVRLWRSKSIISHDKNGAMQVIASEKTPLHELEPVIRRMVGPRPTGEPYAAWIIRATHERADVSLVAEAIDLHQRIRFDPDETEPGARIRLEKLTRELRGSLRTS